MQTWQQPLINRLIDRAHDLHPPDFNAALAEVLAALRRCSTVSVARAAIRALDVEHLGRIDQLGAAPWQSMLLLKWKLLQSAGPVHVGREMAQEEFDRIRQLIWSTNSAQDAESPGFNVATMMRAYMAVQMEFQRRTKGEIIRWPALIARLPEEHVNRRQFAEATGIDPETFIDLSMATLAAAREGKVLDGSWFSTLRPAYGNNIDQYLALISRSLPDLRDEVRADPAQQVRGRSELKELPYLRRFPLLQLDDRRYASWHPDVLARGLEELVHLKLSTYGNAYSEPFGRVFEAHVLELIADAGLQYLDEDGIQRRANSGSKAVEAIISSDGCNVMIEAKMGLFPDLLLVRDDADVLYERIKSIRTGIGQGWAVSDLIRTQAARFREYADAGQDFLIVVTSRELYLGGGLILQRLFNRGRFDYPEGPLGERARQVMPLQNIFVASIGDFESLLGYVQASGRPLGAILRDASTANADEITSKYLLRMHVEGLGPRRGPRMLKGAMNACGARLHQALDPSGKNPFVPIVD